MCQLKKIEVEVIYVGGILVVNVSISSYLYLSNLETCATLSQKSTLAWLLIIHVEEVGS